MSFLSGLKSTIGFLTGNSAASSLVKTIALGYAVNRLSKNALKKNNSGTDNIDKGVRLQIAPNAESKIPVLYGSAFFGGNITDAAMTNNNKTMWYCLVLSEKTGTKFSDGLASDYVFNNIYWNNQRIIFNSDGITANYTVDTNGTIDRNISGLVKVYCYKGGRTAGVVPSGYTGSVPNAETLFPNWTSGTHSMNNLIFALVRVDYNRERNIAGIGDMLFQVSNTMKLPGDALRDYLTNSVYGVGISSNDIISADITALNNYSLENIAYDDQGTGAETLADRYEINGLLDTDNPVLENAEAILNAAASWLSYDVHQGKWGVVINKAETSVASFDDSNILGNINVSGTGIQDLYNSVKVEFPHRELRDSADFYKIEIPNEDRNANEEDNTLNITYDIINEPIQAQMLGLIELKQSRIDKIIRFQTDFGKYNLKAGDVINVTNDRFSFVNKPFRIIAINELQDDGALIMDITALEYDANVYSVADLFRFTRSDVNGIITLGSIGAPGTPVVTKFETDSRPRVVISSTAPSGLVEGLEFWLTQDVEEADDANRSYTIIATKKPVGGGVYTSGETVTLDYDQLGSTNFLVKTRGFNTRTVGVFSNPSGLVEFVPTQTTDAVSEDTKMIGLLSALTLLDLLGKVSDLFPPGAVGSLFDKIFDKFQEETGVDLRAAFGGSTATYVLASTSPQVVEGQAFIITLTTVNVANGTNVPYTITGVNSTDIGGAPLTGNFVVNNNLSTLTFNTTLDAQSEGSETFVLTLNDSTSTTVSVIILDPELAPTYTLSATPDPAIEGRPLTFSLITSNVANGTNVPYTITGVQTADINGASLTGNFTVNSNLASLTLNITNDTIVETESITLTLNGLSVSVTVPILDSDVAEIAGSIRVLNFYPPDRSTFLDPLTGVSSDTAPISGSYFIRYQPANSGLTTFYGPLIAGTGNIKLYKSDGSLVQTVAASSLIIDNNLIEIPFSNRTLGTDYYILMDKGVVKYCTSENLAITTPQTWNFKTAPFANDPFVLTGDDFETEQTPLTVTGINLGEDSCPAPLNLSLTFSAPINLGTGNVYIHDQETDAVLGTIDVTTGNIAGSVLILGSLSSFTSIGGSYYITADAGIALNIITDCYLAPVESTAVNKANNFAFSVIGTLEYVDWSVSLAPFDDVLKVNKQTNIELEFNRSVLFGVGTISLNVNGMPYQIFDVQSSFGNNGSSEIIWIDGNILHLNPTTDLPQGAEITIEADSGSIVDACGIEWDGVNDVEFTVDPGPTSEPSPGFR